MCWHCAKYNYRSIFFNDENLTVVLFVDFLQNTLILDLTQLFPDIQKSNNSHRRIWFQQDGAQPHFTTTVTEPFQIGGQEEGKQWNGPKSHNLSPFDFFLWDYLKSEICTIRLGPKINIKFEHFAFK